MNSYSDYVEYMKKVAAFKSTAGLLQWDQEVMMPEKAVKFRAEQLSHISSLIHGYATDSALGEYLKRAVDDNELTEEQSVNVKRSLEDYEKEEKIPADLVKKLSLAQSHAFQAWVEARDKNEFDKFAPFLEEVVTLKRAYADHLETGDEAYEALLDLYEPGMKVSVVEKIYDELIPGIHNILNNRSADFSENLPKGNFPIDKQLKLGMEICEKLGYDFNAGRQDLSEHPFTLGIHPTDVRITTRVNEESLSYMLWSTIHECGHALYEQGLPVEQHGLPLGEAASLSIHESQSRLYENNLSRSSTFIENWFPRIKETFAEAMEGYDAEKYYHAVNHIEPNLIRTEADELHYHLHVYIRFLIERDLINRNLEVDQLKEKWNSLYKAHLKLNVPDDRRGILQDVHWSHGSMGYFPTYTLGSLYATQFMTAAQEQVEDMKGDIKKNDYFRLLQWLRTHIHCKGRLKKAEDICRTISGERLNPQIFLQYAENKYVY